MVDRKFRCMMIRMGNDVDKQMNSQGIYSYPRPSRYCVLYEWFRYLVF